MTSIEERVETLRTEFIQLTDMVRDNGQLFEQLRDKITKLQTWYNQYIADHKGHLFIFGLDCFSYQAKIIDVEYDDMKRLYFSITNRMYCEYYKLHQIIIKYIRDGIDDKKILDLVNNNNTFPRYMDL
jgi:hypothetical protein